MNEKVYRKVNPREHLRGFLVKNIRPDGRSTDSTRKINITSGSIQTAVGSAMVKFGRTTAVAGVHATLVEPSSASPEDGILELIVELLPTATVPGQSRGHRASDEALILTHYLQNWILPYIQLEQLCVEKERLVWRLRLTVYIVDNDGNLEDVTALAAVAAIRDVRLPAVRMLDDSTKVSLSSGGKDDVMTDISQNEKYPGSDTVIAEATEERTIPLHADGLPLVVSFSLFEGKALLDPSAEEEAVADSRLTMVFRPNGELRAVDKGGGKPITDALLNSSLDIAKERSNSLSKKLKQLKKAKAL